MSSEDHAELVALHQKMQEYFQTLALAGVSERAIVTSAVTVAAGRVLRVCSVADTADWLRGHARNVEKHGPQIKDASD